MPLQPRFRIGQDENRVLIAINVPHVRVSDVDYRVIDGKDFSFYCKPYLLKLVLPGSVHDEEYHKTTAKYDLADDNGTVHMELWKCTPGEHFPDLDMLTKLMAPKPVFPSRPRCVAPALLASLRTPRGTADHPTPLSHSSGLAQAAVAASASPTEAAQAELEATAAQHAERWERARKAQAGSRPLIEVIASTSAPEGGEESEGMSEGVSAPSPASSPPTPPAAPSPAPKPAQAAMVIDEVAVAAAEGQRAEFDGSAIDGLRTGPVTYGFAGLHCRVLGPVAAELPGIVDLPLPDHTPASVRGAMREEVEDADFDEERYAADALHCDEDPLFQAAVAFKPHWRGDGGGEAAEWTGFTDAEEQAMAALPRTEYLLPDGSAEQRTAFLSMATVLLSYAYDSRLTAGEPNVESEWTICKLSPALSWLQEFSDAPSAVRACIRRCVTYPYMRCWRLARLAAADSAVILRGGRRRALRCLLHVRSIMERSEMRYLMNKIFITDMCVWCQQVGDEAWAGLTEEWASAVAGVKAAHVGWDLKGLAVAAAYALLAEEDSDEDDSASTGSTDSSDSSASAASSDSASGEAGSEAPGLPEAGAVPQEESGTTD